MLLAPLFRTIQRTLGSTVLKNEFGSQTNTIARGMHSIFSKQTLFVPYNGIIKSFLQPATPILNHVCGMKQRGRLQLRCKGCYYVTRKERMYVMCKLEKRHKQMAMKKRAYKSWILTSVSQTKVRPW